MNTDLQIERWSVDRLIPYARNARTHSPEQVAQIAASIAEFGWTNPILIGADGVVIAGHARLLARISHTDPSVPRRRCGGENAVPLVSKNGIHLFQVYSTERLPIRPKLPELAEKTCCQPTRIKLR